MKKIIHLSDTHIGYGDLAARMEEIVTRIIFIKEPAHDYIVIHTGDIVESATADGAYERALVQFNRLREAGFHLLCVPGNHDYGTGALGLPETVPLFKEAFYGSAGIEFPKKDLIDDIAFIGLDSMVDELHWYDRIFAEGELGENQLHNLRQMLAEDSDIRGARHRVVYLHHHPFHPTLFNQLKDSAPLGDILKERRIDALLFGHNHEGRIWNGKWGIPRVYDGGSATGKHGTDSPHRVIDLSRDPATDYDARF